jgi:hypothetical protein
LDVCVLIFFFLMFVFLLAFFFFDIGICCVRAIVKNVVCFFVFFMFWYRVVSLGCDIFLLSCGVHGWAMRLFLCFVILG